MDSKFTVFFEDPFWVGVYERQDEDGYSLARVIFGSEPTDAELFQFILEHYDEFRFSRTMKLSAKQVVEKNYKRAQREARKVMQEQGIGTKAQQAMKMAMTELKQERREISREELKQENARRYQEQQEKKKEKHRGH